MSIFYLLPQIFAQYSVSLHNTVQGEIKACLISAEGVLSYLLHLPAASSYALGNNLALCELRLSFHDVITQQMRVQ